MVFSVCSIPKVTRLKASLNLSLPWDGTRCPAPSSPVHWLEWTDHRRCKLRCFQIIWVDKTKRKMSGSVTMEPCVTVATVTSSLLSVESSDWTGQVHYSISNLKRKHAGGEKQNREKIKKIKSQYRQRNDSSSTLLCTSIQHWNCILLLVHIFFQP